MNADTDKNKAIYRRRLIGLIIIVSCFMAAYHFIDVRKVFSLIGSLTWPHYIPFLTLALCSYAFRLLRWQVLLRQVSDSPKLGKLYQIYLTGFVLSATPAKVGETLRSVFLKKYNIDYAPSLAAFFAERLQDLVVVVLLAVVALTLFPTYLPFIAVAAIFVLITAALLASKWPHWLLKKLIEKLKHKLAKQSFLVDIDDFFLWLKQYLAWPSLVKTFPLTIAAWVSQMWVLYWVLVALQCPLSLVLVIGIYGLATLIGALSFIPAGIGATEASLSLLLISQGIETEMALAASIIFRLCTLWFAIAIGIVALGKLLLIDD